MLLSTQASTKVYRSRHGTSAELSATISDEALLVSLPDPVVCFADSRFEQRQTFELASAASLVAVDWFTSGRRESGERCAFTRYYSRIDVRIERQPVVVDAMALSRREEHGHPPSSRGSDIISRMGRFDVLAVAIVVGASVVQFSRDLLEQLREQPVTLRPGRVVVASPIDKPGAGDVGCVLRVAGQSVEEVGRTLRDSLSFVPGLLGDDPWARKW
jgi:urease accessory protein